MKQTADIQTDAILQLLGNSLFGSEITVDFDQVNFTALFNETVKQTVIAHAFESIPRSVAEKNKEICAEWEKYSFSVIGNNLKQLYANVELDKLLNGNSISYCTIKGFSSAYYYKKPNLRQMGDIDFLVAEKDAEATMDLLNKSGFTCADKQQIHDFHVAFHKGKQVYEMHIGITEAKDTDSTVKDYMQNVLLSSGKVSTELGEIVIPDKVSHAITMLLHLRRHMRDGEGIGLRHFCDWAVFADSVSNEEYHNELEPVLKQFKLTNMAKAFSKAASDYLGMPEKDWFCDFDSLTAELLLNDIIKSGNFGLKDPARVQQRIVISGRKSGVISNLFFRYIQKIYRWRSFYKKHKYLLPIGMVVYFFRTTFLLIVGVKKLDKKSLSEGIDRNNLYNSLFDE